METKEVKDRALMWYFHPSERVRLLRINLKDNIDPKLDLTPNYSEDLKFGVVLNSSGNIALLDLSLFYLINVNHIKNILVHDNCSSNQEQLKVICKSYQSINADLNLSFHSPSKRLWGKEGIGSIANQNLIYIGLKWAENEKLDILIRMSDDLIPCYNWINDLKELILKSNGITFGSYCEKKLIPFRSEMFAMNVKAWCQNNILDYMNWLIENEFSIFEDFWYGDLAKQLDFQNYSEIYQKYKKEHLTGFIHSGYVHWYDILGTNSFNDKHRKNDKILDKNYISKEKFLEISKQVFGNKYTLEDFN